MFEDMEESKCWTTERLALCDFVQTVLSSDFVVSSQKTNSLYCYCGLCAINDVKFHKFFCYKNSVKIKFQAKFHDF